MKFGIIVFPGSNCDRDCHHVVTRVLGEEAEYVWHRDTLVDGFDALIIPGGFSYGDYLRCGAIAKLSPVMEAVGAFARKGGPVIGICNGFQILLECGLLPGAMLRNRSLRFICKPQQLRVATTRTPFTSAFDEGQVVDFPIAHAEGNYTIYDDGLRKLRDNDQIVFEYVDNPNGSTADIAGICNVEGNVLGLMPHPERAAESELVGTDGRLLFEGIVATLGGSR